ncbi:MAG: carbon storage regulator [Planctomycetia bacterium]|nr:carbon storage regulator [Planctomycetia bacterium]
MLVLSRKQGEQIRIGDNIVITVQRLSGNRVSLGIEAPSDCKIMRGELEAILESVGAAPSVSHDAPQSRGIAVATMRAKHVGQNRIREIIQQTLRPSK